MKKYLLIAGTLGIVVLLVRKLTASRKDWTNMTEEEARQQIHDRFPNRMPEERKEVVTDKIVSKMKEKGALIDLTDAATETEAVDGAAAAATDGTATTT